MEKIQKNIVLIKLDIDMKKFNFSMWRISRIKSYRKKISIDELKDMKECGLCGTAAVISPVAKINDIKFETSEETVIRKLLIL